MGSASITESVGVPVTEKRARLTAQGTGLVKGQRMARA